MAGSGATEETLEPGDGCGQRQRGSESVEEFLLNRLSGCVTVPSKGMPSGKNKLFLRRLRYIQSKLAASIYIELPRLLKKTCKCPVFARVLPILRAF